MHFLRKPEREPGFRLPPGLKRQEEAERLGLLKTGRSHGDAHDTRGAAGGRGRPGCG